MAVKKKTTTKKSNVSKSAKKQSFRFRWWMAVIAVGVIAIVGIVVIRFSNAADVNHTYQLNAPTFAHAWHVWQHDQALPALGGGIKNHSVYSWSAYPPKDTPQDVWGPYLDLPYSNYIDVCWLINTNDAYSRATFDVTANGGQKILASQTVGLDAYVNKTVPGFGYPAKCIYNVPLVQPNGIQNRYDVEFRIKLNWGNINFNGVTYRQHN